MEILPGPKNRQKWVFCNRKHYFISGSYYCW